VKPGLKSAVEEEKKDKEDKSREGKKRWRWRQKKEMAIVTITAMSGVYGQKVQNRTADDVQQRDLVGNGYQRRALPLKNDPPADQLSPVNKRRRRCPRLSGQGHGSSDSVRITV
jgi:hypothetical protein